MAYWAEKDYTPFFLFDDPIHTMREVRQEYSRTRDIISKRAARLEKAGFNEQARYLRETMPRLSELKTESEIKNRLVQGHHLHQGAAENLGEHNRREYCAGRNS